MFQVVLDTLLPSQAHPALPYGVFEAGFGSFYQNFKRTANANLRHSFQLALLAATWISPLLIHRIPPLTLYPRETRERALAAMETSRVYLLRQMIFILKTVVSLCYGGNREVRLALGYPPQPDDPRDDP
ncbi:MAG TPA: hypothetical protein VF813_03075 [Anaerolineaceae bacterium]